MNNSLKTRYILLSRCFGTNIIGLPFKLSYDDALKIIFENHGLFERDIREANKQFSKRKLIKAYIPMHTAIIKNVASKYHGEKGIDRTEIYWITVPNKNGKGSHMQMITRIVTDWYPVSGESYSSDYNVKLELNDFHIYGDFEFPRKYISECLIMKESKSMYHQLSIPSDTKIFPHNMNYSKAFNDILKSLQNYEESKAENHIIDIHNCDHSRIDRLFVKLEKINLETFSYHVPVYLYITEIDGKKICKMVNGYNGKYNGDLIYSTLKVGIGGTLLGGFLAVASLPFFPVYLGLARLIMIRVGLGSVMGGIFSGAFSSLYTNYQYEKTREDLIKDKEENKKTEETLEDVERRQLNFDNYYDNSNAEKNNKYSMYKRELDLLEINLDNNEKLTLVKLKSSRVNVLKKWHPDTYIGDKETANLVTVQINEAYNTLLQICE